MCVWVPAGQIDDAERRQEVPKDGVQNAEFRRDRLHVDSASDTRYTLSTADAPTVQAAAREALESGQKVLWVSNRVRRCQAVGTASIRTAAPLLYHSRYRYVDRVQRHRAVIEGFRASGAVLASTTQVCEVSLDLSADLLITDLATVPALIQRLGRLNRTHPDVGSKHALVIPVEDRDALPYTDTDLALARAWLIELGNGPVSQRDLAAAFERLAPLDPPRQQRGSAWIEGGPVAAPAELREAGTTISILRAEDAADRSADAVLRNLIPMPYQPVIKEFKRWERAGAALIAAAGRIQYDPLTGAGRSGRNPRCERCGLRRPRAASGAGGA